MVAIGESLCNPSTADRAGFDPDCEFCAIVAGTGSAEIVYEDENSLAFFPLNPATTGHTLVIPKRHYSNFLLMDASTSSNVFASSLTVSRALVRAVQPAGMNLITSAGEAATQTVMHLHIHVVPRWDDDALGEIWPPPHPSSRQMLNDLGKMVRDAIDDRKNSEPPDQKNSNEQDRSMKHAERR